jgi:hypothetical protein
MVLNNPSNSKTINFGAANDSDISAKIFSAYKRGFRIVFLLDASLVAIAFVFAAALMPEIEIKREKMAESGESQSRSRVLVKETMEEGNGLPRKESPKK